MLEFIVLGQIPGTSIVITFHWVLVMSILFASVVYVGYIHKRREQLHASAIEEITL